MTTPSASMPAREGWPAALAIVFLLACNLPYAWLIQHFGYDDILREPAAVVLARFQAGGPPLVLAWLAFAASALLFIPLAWAVEQALARAGAASRIALTLAVASALAQAAGLLRWVLVVPALAAAHADPGASNASREAVLVVFDAVHRYGGMVLGEMLGQLLLAGWTAVVAAQLWRSRRLPRPLALAGMATVPLWLLGQTELLQPLLPGLPLFEVIPAAFIAWQLWLALVAAGLLARRPPAR